MAAGVPEPPRQVRRSQRAVVLEQLRHGGLKLLDGLIGHAEQIRVHHELAPHLHVGGRALVKRREIAQPVAQRLAFRHQVVAADAASGQVVADHAQRNGRGHHEQRGNEVLLHHRDADARDRHQDCQSHQIALIALALRLEEVLAVRRRRQPPLPAGHGVDELLRVILAVLLDAAEPQRIGPAGNAIEEQFERRAVDGMLHIVGSGQAGDEVVGDLLRAEHALFRIGAGIDAHGPDMRQVHERGGEVVLALSIPSPQTPDDGRVNARVGHVAPVLVGEVGGIFLPVLEVRAQRPGQQHDAHRCAADDEGQRKHAIAVRFVGPAPLLVQHRVEPQHIAAGLRRISGKVGEPLHREHHACLGVLPGCHVRHAIDHRPVGVHRQRAVGRAVAPCAHVVARAHLGALRNGKGERHRHVVRCFSPLIAHVLPIHLSHVLERPHAVDDGVIELDHHPFVGGVEEHIHRILRFVERVRVRAGAALVAPSGHERDGFERRPFARHRAVV